MTIITFSTPRTSSLCKSPATTFDKVELRWTSAETPELGATRLEGWGMSAPTASGSVEWPTLPETRTFSGLDRSISSVIRKSLTAAVLLPMRTLRSLAFS